MVCELSPHKIRDTSNTARFKEKHVDVGLEIKQRSLSTSLYSNGNSSNSSQAVPRSRQQRQQDQGHHPAALPTVPQVSHGPEPEKEQRSQSNMPGAWPVGGIRPASGFRHVPSHGHRAAAGVSTWDRLDRLVYPEQRCEDSEPSARVGAPRGIPGRKVYRPGMTDDGATITGVQARLQARPHQSYNYGGAQLPMRVQWLSLLRKDVVSPCTMFRHCRTAPGTYRVGAPHVVTRGT
ncbi:hypothetical protein M438DRAFT_401988 [Aureobasidium pullulans EXF-150]|uniref:Uncharacterized protein n=1 Tax=Aureobasidium pullulans EXF-150 TaxID=1043002 RepID=A0A074Y236_AURPU|nr:uncharacterized protein M438DRAFT_401988 [Aureobasidium pullulans EXF-150]KEQ89984.1 hypothetical protein M438DRAFT_401988 [Aureobasidium pullulans EXF-150]